MEGNDNVTEEARGGGGGDSGDGVREQQSRGFHFKERVSGKQYDLVIDDYIEDHNYDRIPHIHGNYDQIKLLQKITSTPHGRTLFKQAPVVCTVISSCFLTYSISNHEPFLSAVVSEAVVIIMVLVAFPELSAASAVGAFAGMASSDAIINYGWLTLLSIVVSVLWLLYNYFTILVGFGGRIGTCAFLSMNIVALITMLSGKVPWTLYGDANELWSQQLELVTSILTVLASTILSGCAGAVRLHRGIPLNPIQTPTLLVLFCMLILEPATSSQVKQISNGLAVGSFVAMASTEHLPTILDFIGAGFVAGLFLLLLDPFFNGFGGKDGFAAFCGFTAYMALSKVARRLYTNSS